MATVLQTPLHAENWSQPVPLTMSDTVFNAPHDLTITQDGLYLLVADKGNNVVQVLTPGDLRIIGEIGTGVFNQPHDIAADNQNKIYVADTANGRISVFQFNGVSKYIGVQIEHLTDWDEGIIWPEGIAITTNKRAYVADVKANALLVLDDGKVTHTIREAGGTQFSRPHDVEVDSEGNIYLSDPGNDRIVIFNSNLEFIKELNSSDYGFDEPKYISIDEDNMLFITDQHNDRIVMLADDLHSVGDIDEGIVEIAGPEGIAVAGRYIWISDTGNNRIILLRRNRQ